MEEMVTNFLMDNEKMDEMVVNFLIFPVFFQKIVSSKEALRKQKIPSYYPILQMLEQEGDLPISVIGSRLYYSRPNMTWNINKLVEDGMVKRIADEKDGRIIRVSITPKGREFIKKSRKQVDKYIKKNLSPLSNEELEELYHSAQSIKKVLLKIQE